MRYLRLQIRSAGFACLAFAAVVMPGLATAQPSVEIVFENQFGQGGIAAGQFSQPIAVAVSNANQIVIIDQANSRYQVCNHSGQCQAYGVAGSDAGQFSDPQGITVDGTNQILITESVNGNSRIQICDDSGGCSIFRPLEANGISTDSEDRMVIASASADGVYICRLDFACTFFGGSGSAPGNFSAPQDVALDAQDRIFVADTLNNRIQVCDSAGNCTAFGEAGTGPGQFSAPAGIAVDDFDRIIVADTGNHRIQVCEDQGDCTVFGDFGQAPGQFNSPAGIAVDNNNRIIVSEKDGNRIQVLRIDNTGFTINSGISGAWANFETLGQGFFIDVLPDIPLVFLAWFTWEAEQVAPAQLQREIEKLAKSGSRSHADLGDDNHRWITAQGPFDGNSAELQVTLTTGGIFDDSAPVTNSEPGSQGTITLTFSDCENGIAEYDFTSAGLSGQVPIKRLASDSVAYCNELNLQAQKGN